MKSQHTRILHVEDIRSDADLVKREMQNSKLSFEWLLVSNRIDFKKALSEYRPSIILCDHSLPGFTSTDALNIIQEAGVKIPFILVTATVSEEFAVMMMRDGVADYVLKDRLQRLPTAVTNALEKWEAMSEREAGIANLTAIIENSDTHIYSLDRNFRYITFNSFLKNTLKQVYGIDIYVGDKVFDFLDKLDPAESMEWENKYTEALSGKPIHFIKEFNIGNYHTFSSFSINPIRQGDQIIGLSCFATDVTAEKLADEKVKASELRFRALIENNYDALTLRDENLNLLYSSPSANKMIGNDESEISGDSFNDTIHADDIGLMNFLFTEAKENPGKVVHCKGRIKHKNGSYIWIEGTIRNMLSHKSVRGIIFNYRNISEQVESDSHREQITSDIIQRNKDLEQFTYIVSHNLRAPVANILGISNLLDIPALNEADKLDALAGITSSARKLDEVIGDMNEILREKRKITEYRKVVHFEELIHDVHSSIPEMIEQSKTVIKTDFQEIESILSVKSYLYSIFYNLITNSIKYRQPDVPLIIEVKSYMANTKTILTFSDNGLGIDMESQGQKVFGLYKRFHPGIEGKGMGLFMVKTQVETLGGTITITSKINHGTVFTIIL